MSRAQQQFTAGRLQFLIFFQWFGCCCSLAFLLPLYYFPPASWPEQSLNLTAGFFALLLAALLFQFNLAPAGKSVAAVLVAYLSFVVWCYFRTSASPLRYFGYAWFEMFFTGGWLIATGAIFFRPCLEQLRAEHQPRKPRRPESYSAGGSLFARLPAANARSLALLTFGCLSALALLAALDTIHQVFWRFDDALKLLEQTIRKEGRSYTNDAIYFALAEKRASGKFGNANAFCAFLALLIPAICGWLALVKNIRLRGAIGIGLALVIYAATLSHSRGGMLCVLLALGLGLLMLGKPALRELRLLLLAAAALALLLCVFVRPTPAPQQDLPGMEAPLAEELDAAIGAFAANGTKKIDATQPTDEPDTATSFTAKPAPTTTSTPTLALPEMSSAPATRAIPALRNKTLFERIMGSKTLRERYYYWQSAGEMIRDAPLAGHGLGSYVQLYQKYKVREAHEVRDAHQLFLQLWAESGLTGLALFLCWLFAIFFLIWRARTPLREFAAENLLAHALLAALAVFLLDALYDLSYSPAFRQYFYTLCLLLGIGAGKLEEIGRGKNSAPEKFHGPWPAALPPLIFVLMFLTLGWRAMIQPGRAAVWTDRAQLLAGSGQPAAAYDALRRAMTLTPDDPEIYRKLSSLRRNSGDLLGAVQHIEQAIARAPEYAGYRSELGRLELAAGHFSEAERAFLTAIRLYPLNSDYRVELSRVYQQQQKWPQAIMAAQAALYLSYDEYKPKRLEQLAQIYLACGEIVKARAVLLEALQLAEPHYKPRYQQLLRELNEVKLNS